jgi:F-type H+-transporting ATPase subunit b
MELLTPQLGLFFWTLVIFLGFFFILRKFAWGPILGAIKSREESIDTALKQASQAREEMQMLSAKNEEELRAAREERARIVRDAESIKEKILAEAQEKAREEATRRIQTAELQIENAKKAAITELRNVAGQVAIQVAEQLLRREFANKGEQERLVQEMIGNLNVGKN